MVFTVHGVILKYVILTTFAGSWALYVDNRIIRILLSYVAITNLIITIAFAVNRGARWIGKNERTGQLPLWSMCVWFGFCGPTWLYTMLHQCLGKRWKKIPEATEIFDGWWLGGRYADLVRERPSRFAGILDLTCELPERLRDSTDSYKLVPVWDGTPPKPDEIEDAALYCVASRKLGHVLIHCAHGRGRSTTVIVAALVRAKKFNNWRDAFAVIKSKRPCVSLNSKMRNALEVWQDKYPVLVPTGEAAS
mmetsp:Transcript_13751/g.18341  ORF Transcript_13751/g.18341 Transcript_13751/m.18341 type:complete len:250 (+) Transcript_13751:40-789(+)